MPRRRYTIIVIAAIITLLLLTPSLQVLAGDNYWTTTGPYGVSIWEIAIDPDLPNVMYAAADGGVYKSINYGSTWYYSGQGLNPQIPARNIAIAPNNEKIIYVTTDDGLYRSMDDGDMWESLRSGDSLWGLAVDPVNPNRIYAAGSEILISEDSGVTWTNPADSGNHTWIRDIIIDPNNSDILYAADDYYGVLKSSNKGLTWTSNPIGPNWSIRVLAIRMDNSNILYAGGVTGLYVSDNGGSSWIPIGNVGDRSVYALVVDPAASGSIYIGIAGQDAGVYKSADNGQTWIPWQSGMGSRDVTALGITHEKPQKIIAGTSTGIWDYTVLDEPEILLEIVYLPISINNFTLDMEQ